MRCEVRADVEVEGESEIEAGDIATITVRLTRQHEPPRTAQEKRDGRQGQYSSHY